MFLVRIVVDCVDSSEVPSIKFFRRYSVLMGRRVYFGFSSVKISIPDLAGSYTGHLRTQVTLRTVILIRT